MKVFVDTNVVLDVLLERQPFYNDSFFIFQLVNMKRIRGYLSAASITDIFFIANRELKNRERVYNMVEGLTALFTIAPVTETTVTDALTLRWKDFEDAVQFVTARENGAAYIITRNTQDFSSGSIEAATPEQFIRAIADIEK